MSSPGFPSLDGIYCISYCLHSPSYNRRCSRYMGRWLQDANTAPKKWSPRTVYSLCTCQKCGSLGRIHHASRQLSRIGTSDRSYYWINCRSIWPRLHRFKVHLFVFISDLWSFGFFCFFQQRVPGERLDRSLAAECFWTYWIHPIYWELLQWKQ